MEEILLSANNGTVIVRKKFDGDMHFYVYRNGCVDNEFVEKDNDIIYRTTNLELAIKVAIDQETEYGVSFKGF